MIRHAIVLVVFVAGLNLLAYPSRAQDKDKKIKNIFYGKILEVKDDKVVVKFEKDWNNEKMDKEYTFSGDSFKVLVLKVTKDVPSKEAVKVKIEDLDGKVVPGREAPKVLFKGMKFLCPIYNGGPPEKDGTIVVTGKGKK